MSPRLSRPRNTRTVLRSTRLLLVQGKNGEGMATITVTLRTELDPGPCALRVSSLVRYPSSLDDRDGPTPYYTIHMRTSENLLCALSAPPPFVEVFAHVPTCPGASLQIRRAGADVKATRHRIQAETARTLGSTGWHPTADRTSASWSPTCLPECGARTGWTSPSSAAEPPQGRLDGATHRPPSQRQIAGLRGWGARRGPPGRGHRARRGPAGGPPRPAARSGRAPRRGRPPAGARAAGGERGRWRRRCRPRPPAAPGRRPPPRWGGAPRLARATSHKAASPRARRSQSASERARTLFGASWTRLGTGSPTSGRASARRPRGVPAPAGRGRRGCGASGGAGRRRGSARPSPRGGSGPRAARCARAGSDQAAGAATRWRGPTYRAAPRPRPGGRAGRSRTPRPPPAPPGRPAPDA